jgi:ring-1,2-phenylacetyl-CoA epoxidase subunit PaaE
MGLFDRFKKSEKPATENVSRGFHAIAIQELKHLNSDSVQVSFQIPVELQKEFAFVPGQYINLEVLVNEKKERRSYSICSGPSEPLAVAVKRIDNGLVSNFLNDQKTTDFPIWISKPEGNFKLISSAKNIVCIAAGSGITPILSMGKHLSSATQMHLFYGSKQKDGILFEAELASLSNVHCTHYLSQEERDGFEYGRITKDRFTEKIKANLSLLQADAFYICGPSGLVQEMQDCLSFFGVAKDKIHVELFTAVESSAPAETVAFAGESKVKVMIDGETASFVMKGEQHSVLELAEKNGLDAPYSCRGGVCCSCRAKVLKGSAKMRSNFSLTDEEVNQGYILTCQAFPTSDELIVSFDE